MVPSSRPLLPWGRQLSVYNESWRDSIIAYRHIAIFTSLQRVHGSPVSTVLPVNIFANTRVCQYASSEREFVLYFSVVRVSIGSVLNYGVHYPEFALLGRQSTQAYSLLARSGLQTLSPLWTLLSFHKIDSIIITS